MKRLLIALASSAVLLAATPAIASAASTNHICRVSNGAVTASGTTSCAFANAIMNAYLAGNCRRYSMCKGYAASPVTHKTYRITAYTHSSYAVVDTSGTGRTGLSAVPLMSPGSQARRP